MSENSDLPTPEEIVEIHAEIEREYDFKYTGARVVAPELKLKRLLDDVDEYSGVYHRAAALLRKILTAHYFEDGNKRTAWTVTVLYLEEHDHEPAERGHSVERVLRRIRRYSVGEIAEWLETGDLDEDRLHP